jgi:hypothetical protein
LRGARTIGGVGEWPSANTFAVTRVALLAGLLLLVPLRVDPEKVGRAAAIDGPSSRGERIEIRAALLYGALEWTCPRALILRTARDGEKGVVAITRASIRGRDGIVARLGIDC